MKIEIELNEKETKALEDMCKAKDMTPEQVIKQGFRFYQTIDKKLELGIITQDQYSDFMRLGMPSKLNPEQG